MRDERGHWEQCSGQNHSRGKVVVKLGGGLVTVQKSMADISEVELDLGLTYQGMIKELNALKSLAVEAKGHLGYGEDPIFYQHLFWFLDIHKFTS